MTNDIKLYSVGNYLDLLNIGLHKYKARVKGEVSSISDRPGYLFFSIKDAIGQGSLNCLIWRNNYEICGIALEQGMEIIVNGFPEIYKPSGQITFKASTIELVGEGALKKAYNELKKKLEKEGLFDIDKKKLIPEFSKKIGLITSERGAVIHDFLNNLGKHGYHIKFIDSRVEGQIAVQDLISAVDYFRDKDIDVLVLIRGGGSIESLQSFNNETLIRKISNFKIPVICGIGHDKDIPLISLVADKAVSTPTATAIELNKSWDQALNDVMIFEKDIIYKYQKLLEQTNYYFEILSNKLEKQFTIIFKKFEESKHCLKNALINIGYKIEEIKKSLNDFSDLFINNLKTEFEQNYNILNDIAKQLKIFNPTHILKLGYSIVFCDNKVIKSVEQVKKEQEIDIQISDGKIKSKIKNIIKN
ncbi:MAG: exodeoxyribonuclease VII large subunit [Patescibacteria group bacterium]|nr:exodeoxyribonuclease VII large subunit [Patescibacteria group bacterium]